MGPFIVGTGKGFTKTVDSAEFAGPQTPLWIVALNFVDSTSGFEVYVAEVFAISVQVVNGEVLLCHFTTDPVWPERVSKPLVLPEQIIVPPVTVPPTEIWPMVTVVSKEFAGPQTPLWTTALNFVVWVSGFER